MKLHADDPGAMKDFILSIQNSVNQLKSQSAVLEDGKADIHSKRVSFLVQCTRRKHCLPAMFYNSLTGFNLRLRWNLCSKQYATLRTIRKGLKRILHTILE
jgi:hypothetical protein